MALKLISSQTWFPNPNSQGQDVHIEAKLTQTSIWCMHVQIVYFNTYFVWFRLLFQRIRHLGHKNPHTDTIFEYIFQYIFLYFKVIKIYYFVFHMICHNYQKISISGEEIKKKALGGKLATYTLTTKRSLSCLHQLHFKTKFEEMYFVQTKCWSFRKKTEIRQFVSINCVSKRNQIAIKENSAPLCKLK